MTRRDTIALLAGVAAANLIGGCGTRARNRCRFRMTVEVETPQGLKSGSSVMELSAALARFKLPDSAAVALSFKGEAVAVDLPGGTLFALVGKTPAIDSFEGAVINTFDHRRPGEAKLVAMIGKLGAPGALGREAVMRPQDYPTLVRFRDLRDPRTVELLDPNDLANTFGAGVHLRRILLVVVKEPITTGIEKRLAWLGQHPETSLNPLHSDSDFLSTARLKYGDFIGWGANK